MDAEIREYRNNLILITNNAALPIEVKRLVFAEILHMVEEEADKAVAKEKEAAAVKADEEFKEPENLT